MITLFFGILILLSFLISGAYSDVLVRAETKEKAYKAIIALVIWVPLMLFFTYCFYESIGV